MEDKTMIYLVCVTENNNNKVYQMANNGDGTFTATWGRVEGHMSSKVYSMSKWNSTYNSKLKKGYTDQTSLMTDIIEASKVEEDNTPIQDKFSVIPIQSIKDVLKRLYDYANNLVQSSYKSKASAITQAMVDFAQEKIDYISSNYTNWDIKTFNQELLKLWAIIPRKMSDTRYYLANDTESFDKIIVREQETLDALAGQVFKRVEKCENDAQNDTEKCVEVSSILTEMGIEMEETDEHEDEMLKKMMGDSSGNFYRAWRVCNQEAEERFREYCRENNITKRKLLCHGSRNANWFNILKLSLMIRPSNAIYTGSLLGDALYFSNPENYHGGVVKSVRYSSLNGYWSGECQNCGFIAFFEVATGDSYDIYNFDSRYHTYNLDKLQKDCPGAWSLHLHGAGYGGASTVINDEITVYNKNQVSIRYLVEIR